MTLVKSKKYIYWLENILTNSKYIYYHLRIKNPAKIKNKKVLGNVYYFYLWKLENSKNIFSLIYILFF